MIEAKKRALAGVTHMKNIIIEQRERITELEGMLSKSIDKNKTLEEALKRVSHYVERLEAENKALLQAWDEGDFSKLYDAIETIQLEQVNS